jgi:hypothetical protein
VNETVTNETGSYQFASLQTGTYEVTVELPGFRVQKFTNVLLGGSQQVRLNVILQLGGIFRWTGPGRLELDANLVKKVRVDEKRDFEFRADVVNVMNHRSSTIRISISIRPTSAVLPLRRTEDGSRSGRA